MNRALEHLAGAAGPRLARRLEKRARRACLLLFGRRLDVPFASTPLSLVSRQTRCVGAHDATTRAPEKVRHDEGP